MELPECKYENSVVELAFIKHDVDICFHDNCLVLDATVDYGNYQQGIGYYIDTDFIAAFIRAFGVTSLLKVGGNHIFIERENGTDKILRFTPLVGTNGIEFDMREWSTIKYGRWEMDEAKITDTIS